MTDWYYHDPGQGRVGPLTAEELLARYRDRRVLRDSLVWHEGLREWQPLDRLSEELDLDSVVPDASQPPPLPAAPREPMAAARGASRQPLPAHALPAHAPRRRRMSGCLIAAIALAILALPVLGILAAIAIPAYQDYTVRAKVAQVLDGSKTLRGVIAQRRARTGLCPDSVEAPFGRLDSPLNQTVAATRIGTLDNGHCAIEFRLRNLGDPDLDGRTVLLEAVGGGRWDCSGGSLAAKYRPSRCRHSPPERTQL